MKKCTQQTRWKITLLLVIIFTSSDPLIRAQSSDQITGTVWPGAAIITAKPLTLMA